jgi:hypothetical protein
LNLAIYQSQDKIAKLELTADGLTSDVNAIKAGKNLLPLTSGWEGYGGAAVKYDKKNFGVWDENSDLYSPFIRLAEGQSVCFSAYMSSYAAQSGNWYIGYGSTPPVHLSDLYDNARIPIALTQKPGDSITVDGTTYDRYYYVLNAGTVFVDQYITFNFAGLYKLFCPQLENGNAPTAFTAGSIETSSQIKQTADEIDLSITNKLGDTGIKINGNNRQIDLIAGKVNFCNSQGTAKTYVQITSDGKIKATDGEFEGNIKSGKYTEDSQTKFANELAIDGSGHLAKGNIAWDENGNSDFSGVIHASLLYSNTIGVDGGMYTIDPENSPANTFMVHSAIITLPSAEDYLGLELKFFEPHPTTRSIQAPTTLSPQSNEYIAKTYFDLVPLLEMVTQYTVPMGRFVTLKATKLWYNGHEYYCWMVASGDDGGYSGTVQIGNKTMTYLNGMLMDVETV